MRSSLALALALALALPGCASPKPAYTHGVVELDVNVLPVVGHLLFRLSAYNGYTFDIPSATYRVEVSYAASSRGIASAPLDANQTTQDLGARKIVNVDIETKFVDVGDYFWNVTIRDSKGQLAANQSGRYETCAC